MTSSKKLKLMLFLMIFAFILSDEGVFAEKYKGMKDFSYKHADESQTQTMAEKVPGAIFILFIGLFMVLFKIRFNI